MRPPEGPPIDLSVCVVSWNACRPLGETLQSLRENAGALRLEILVVDNASADGSAEMVKRRFPEAILIRSGGNIGFGRANNLAIPRARGRYVLLLNPDIVVRPGALERLIGFLAAHPEAGVAGCRLVNRDGSVQKSWFDRFPSLGSELGWGLMLHRLGRGAREVPARGRDADAAGDRPVAYVVGACMVFRREVLQALGGFDPRYFMYGEDVDLCYRLHRMGLEVYYLGSIEILHHHGVSSGKQSRPYFAAVMQKESRYRFLLIHRGRRYALSYRLIWIGSGLFRTALGALVWAAATLILQGRRRAVERGLATAIHILSWGLGLERWILR